MTKYKFKLTDDTQVLSEVTAGLTANQREFGKPYCPCATEQTEDTVCKCKKLREEGICCCGLYTRVEVADNANG